MKKLILFAALGLTLAGSISSCSSTRFMRTSHMKFTN